MPGTNHPPSALSVPQAEGAVIGANLARKIQPGCDKMFAVEAVDVSLMIISRVYAKFARSGFHHGAYMPAAESIRVGVSCESPPCHFDCAVGRADPKVAVADFGQGPYPGV